MLYKNIFSLNISQDNIIKKVSQKKNIDQVTLKRSFRIKKLQSLKNEKNRMKSTLDGVYWK